MEYPRTLNVRFLCWMMLSVVILTVGVMSVHALQLRRNSDIFKSEAMKAVEKSQYDVAVHYYFLYLEYNRDDVDALIAYGRAYDKKENKTRRDKVKIYENFEKVLRLEPDQHDIRRRLVEIAM